jgi:uncharacterized membrane protein
MALNNKITEEQKETILIEQLKEDLSSKDITQASSPRRIASIDFVKGIAIIFIILCHVSAAWFDSNWIFLHGIVYSFLDILGPSLFIFLSALSVIFSIKSKQGKLPDKVIRNQIFSRGLMIILIGIFINIMLLSSELLFPFNLWGWNIIMFIGFSQIFCYYAMKLKKIPRLIIGVIIIFSSEMIRDIIFYGKDSNPAYFALDYIINSPEATVTLLPWLSICFISTVFGEYLYETMIDASQEAYKHLFRVFIFWGLIFLIFGIFTGLEAVISGNGVDPGTINIKLYYHVYLLGISNQQAFTPFTGMWKFLIRGTFSNMWYNIGAGLLILAIGFYLVDIKRKSNIFTAFVQYYGKVSLNLFLVHYIFLPLYSGLFSIIYFPFVCLGYMGFLGFLFYFWNEYANGAGTPEWLMKQVMNIGKKKQKR